MFWGNTAGIDAFRSWPFNQVGVTDGGQQPLSQGRPIGQTMRI